MTTLREAAQQALEAMRCAVPTGEITLTDWYKSITALKAALAEPVQEPVQDGKCKHCVDGCPACDARKLPVQEPVAWIDDSGHPKHLSHLQSATERRLYGPLRPLYTAPPQRKPLTREEAIALWADKSDGPSNSEIVLYCRAIERAHGIGGAA